MVDETSTNPDAPTPKRDPPSVATGADTLEAKTRALNERQNQTQRARHRRRQREIVWSYLRLLTFAAALYSAGFLSESLWVCAAGALACLAMFALSVVRHRRARVDRQASDRLLDMIAESTQRLGGQVVCLRSFHRPTPTASPDARLEPFLQPGATTELTEQELDDLDIYRGPVGLFGLLNRTSTPLGARRLAGRIEHPPVEPERIQATQHAVMQLTDHPDARLDILAGAAALRTPHADLDGLAAAIQTAEPVPWRLTPALRIWSGVTGLVFVVFLYFVINGGYALAYAMIAIYLVNAAIYGRMRKTLCRRLDPWRRLAVACHGLRVAAGAAVVHAPSDGGELDRLDHALQDLLAPPVLPRLCRLIGWTDVGGPMHVLFNTLMFYDLHVADALMRIVVPHRAALRSGLAALADLEALTALACFSWEQPVACVPTLSADSPRLSARAMVHPLIAPDEAVANDLDINAATRIWIITGSNMAGKSTFLRTAGVNLLLSQIGTCACAEQLTFSPMCLITDLGVRDNLADHESYFLAEVRHLRRVVRPDPHRVPILGLIDEPFRGTNSTERVAATLAVIEHLKSSGNLFLIATHEQRVTELADGSSTVNHHFQEDLSDGQMVFDFRLQPGPALTRNALRVLAAEGYPDTVLNRAHEWTRDS